MEAFVGLIACHRLHHLPRQLAIPKILIGSHVMMTPALLINVSEVRVFEEQVEGKVGSGRRWWRKVVERKGNCGRKKVEGRKGSKKIDRVQ